MQKTLTFFTLVLLAMAPVAQARDAQRFPDFTGLVAGSADAVVNIRTTRERQRSDLDGREIPEIFRRFMPPRQQPRNASGSGFIIEKDGYILTNNHVVEGADEIIVALSDRREREAEVVGKDPLSDLALLKIDEDDLPTVKIGQSEDLKAGQWVIAIGSPFGFEHSVSAGIVSGTGRSLQGEGGNNYVPFIQTDVAINPGNSGGPLLDLDGRVIGINSQIFTRSGGYMGLSFAIPIDVAMEVVEQLKEKGSVSRGWLGVLIQAVNRDLAESFGLDRAAGALVTQVFADSPAEAGGLREGDIILSFNGKSIDLSSDLPHIVGRARADSEAEVEIVRNGKHKTLTVVIGRLDENELASAGSAAPSVVQGNRLGIEIADGRNGVVVREVHPGPAREAGIARGDRITDFDGESITSAEQLSGLIEQLPGDITVAVRIVRGQRAQYIAVKIPADE